METNEYKESLNKFLDRWTKDKIKNMSLNEYIGVRNKDTFCYWVETKTKKLGSINGSTAIKFGIYEREKKEKKDKRYINDDKHTWQRKYGEYKKNAFEKIKEHIIYIIDQSKIGKFELIDDIPLSNMFKWKIAYLYSEERLIPIFSKEILLKIANHYGLKTKNKTTTCISQIQDVMMRNKPSHLNTHEFMKQLCGEFATKKQKNEDEKNTTKKIEKNRIKRKASDIKNTNTQTRNVNGSFNEIWTNDELRVTVLAYIEMLKLELNGNKYNKAKYNENLRSDGLKRSKGSIEYRMQNISAVFEEMGLPIIKGYLPAKNIGDNTKNEIIDIINETEIFDKLFTPTIKKEELEKDVEIIMKLNNKKKPDGIKNPDKKKQEVIVFARDPKVKAFVLQRANGFCELCKRQGPFQTNSGNLFLEVHHLLSMALGGEDTIYNTVAICPNCHRELHYGIEAENKKNILVEYLTEIYKQN